MEYRTSKSFLKAKASVNNIRRFYIHFMFYVFMNIVFFIVKMSVLRFFIDHGVSDEGFVDWFKLNVILTPIIWGIGLFFHGWWVFKGPKISLRFLVPKRIKNWERRLIQKYLKEDEETL